MTMTTRRTSGVNNWQFSFDTRAFLEAHFSAEVLSTSNSAREAVKAFHDIMKDGNFHLFLQLLVLLVFKLSFWLVSRRGFIFSQSKRRERINDWQLMQWDQKGGVLTYYFAKISPKTAWKRRELYRKGAIPKFYYVELSLVAVRNTRIQWQSWSITAVLKWWKKFFVVFSTTGNYHGEKLLDFGCASVLHCTVSPSRYFHRIYYADFPNNLTDTTRWVAGDSGAFDWSHYFQEYARLEGWVVLSVLGEMVPK